MKFIHKIALLLFFASGQAIALESDVNKPITIDSNSATYDDATGTSTYSGNVISVQGSMQVNSDKLVVYFKNGDPEKLIFTGNKARFKQTPTLGSEDIIGEAMSGEYQPKKHVLLLTGDAIVTQGNATYASHLIEYDSRNSIVKAGEKASDNKRVHVTLKPKVQTQ